MQDDKNQPPSAATFRLKKGSTILGYQVASLRTEARRGNLVLTRVAGKDYVTEQAIREMESRCQVQTSVRPRSGGKVSGFETMETIDRMRAAKESALRMAKVLTKTR